jgi:osmotically-inducible protein OsmY
MHERPYWWSPSDHPGRDWRYGGGPYQDSGRRARGDEEFHDRDYEDDEGGRRDWADKATDEVKSWFGNDRAEHRRDSDRRRERRRERDRRRDFRGVGPRTHHEEDEELREMICERLADDPHLDASDILVRVIDNEAILDGAVDSERDARHAYDIAIDTPGIVHVRDRLETHRSRRDRVRRATIGMGYDESPRRRRYTS